MTTIDNRKVNKVKEWEEKDLLKIPEVVDEIKRHLWIESEKAGHDVGFEWAKNDWIKKFSNAWIVYHQPSAKAPSIQPPDTTKRKRRSAKSYLL